VEYDIIGDIHGCHDHLVGLLTMLGYWPTDGVWKHAERTAVFVGDLIDRGPSQWAVIQTVKSMVEVGSAKIVMGNHEFNALAFATVTSENPLTFAREHRLGNIKQHEAFLSQLTPSQQEEALNWFMTMPLWLDFGTFRVVHAYWGDESINFIKDWLQADRFSTREQILQASIEGTEAFRHVELVLKGPEADLKHRDYGIESITDKELNIRTKVRINWWAGLEKTIDHMFDVLLNDLDGTYAESKGRALHADDAKYQYDSSIPVFFGHHWRSGEASFKRDYSDNAFCVDYSAVKGGKLAAYVFDPSNHIKCQPQNVVYYESSSERNKAQS
jgi:hypothetical protein